MEENQKDQLISLAASSNLEFLTTQFEAFISIVDEANIPLTEKRKIFVFFHRRLANLAQRFDRAVQHINDQEKGLI